MFGAGGNGRLRFRRADADQRPKRVGRATRVLRGCGVRGQLGDDPVAAGDQFVGRLFTDQVVGRAERGDGVVGVFPFRGVELVRDDGLVASGVLDAPDPAGQVTLVVPAVPVANQQV